MKKGIVEYILEHCASALGVSIERVSSKNIRDYCFTGFTEDEFLSVRIGWKGVMIAAVGVAASAGNSLDRRPQSGAGTLPRVQNAA